jgi:hypothetical protein
VKHGFRSTEIVLTRSGERVEEFRALLDELTRELKPRTRIEEALVERVATCLWRLRRAQRFEAGAISASLEECSRADTEVADAVAKLKGQHDRAVGRLRMYREDLAALGKMTGLEEPERAAMFERQLVEIAGGVSPLAAGLPPVKLREFLLAKLVQRVEELEREVPRLSDRIKELSEREAHRVERGPLTGSLPAPQEVLKLVRYENMLDRQLHRALMLLRRRGEAGGNWEGTYGPGDEETQGRRDWRM